MFKYVPIDRLDILENGQIRFTQPFDWNDPFEAQPFMLSSNKSNVIDYNRILNTYFVCLSLTNNINNILMWSHYTSNHKGMIIEFDKEETFFTNKDRLLIKVPYFNKRPSMEYNELISILNTLYNSLVERKKFSTNEISKISLLFTKKKCWKYEKEYRLITLSDFAPVIKSKKTKKTIKNKPKEPSVYINMHVRRGKVESDHIFLFPVEPRSIKRIILGCDIDSLNARRLNKILCKNIDYEHIELYKAELDEKQYKLNYKK